MPPHHPPSTSSTRAGMNPTSQETINSLLKSLKAHTRNLNDVFVQHTSEMAVLERLYYKGKNQHGASLLWQRVSEMRRYGKRLQTMNIASVAEVLRATFYGEHTATTVKKLKGAWTHYPSAPYFKWVLRQLLTCAQLLEKTKERYQCIYHWCTVFMQNGAFLQLTVTLAAIVSRLHALNVVTLDTVNLLSVDCHRAMLNVYPTEAQKVDGLDALQPHKAHALPDVPAVTTNEFVETSEDLGIPVERHSPSLPLSSAHSASEVSTTTTRERRLQPHAPQAPNREEKARLPIVIAPSSSSAPVVLKKRKDLTDQTGASAPPQKKKKSKKKQRNEIDDIFS